MSFFGVDCGQDPPVAQAPMPASLEDKLAAMIQHLIEVRKGTRTLDDVGFGRCLDDADINNWITSMDRAGRIKPQFTYGRPIGDKR